MTTTEAAMIRTDRDCWSFLWDNNQPLFEKMIADGYRFKVSERYANFIDAEGKYVDYPIGYITKGYQDNGDGKGHYASVQGPNGWHQRSSANRDEVIAWAKEEAKKVLAAL